MRIERLNDDIVVVGERVDQILAIIMAVLAGFTLFFSDIIVDTIWGEAVRDNLPFFTPIKVSAVALYIAAAYYEVQFAVSYRSIEINAVSGEVHFRSVSEYIDQEIILDRSEIHALTYSSKWPSRLGRVFFETAQGKLCISGQLFSRHDRGPALRLIKEQLEL